jgi:hypothetical protein
MPYIDPKIRELMDATIEDLVINCINTGDWNYIITKLLHYRIHCLELSYDSINSTIGILECCKLELYRQVAAKYEDIKKAENGPVSELDK